MLLVLPDSVNEVDSKGGNRANLRIYKEKGRGQCNTQGSQAAEYYHNDIHITICRRKMNAGNTLQQK